MSNKQFCNISLKYEWNFVPDCFFFLQVFSLTVIQKYYKKSYLTLMNDKQFLFNVIKGSYKTKY